MLPILPRLSTIVRYIQKATLFLVENPIVACAIAGGLLVSAALSLMLQGRAAYNFGFSDAGAHLGSTLNWGLMFCVLLLASFWGIQRFVHGIVGFVLACIGSYTLTMGMMMGLKGIFSFIIWLAKH